ncbi:MAG: DUF7107 domain-containing protein [Archangium sp.]
MFLAACALFAACPPTPAVPDAGVEPDAGANIVDGGLDEAAFLRALTDAACATLERCGLAVPQERSRCEAVLALALPPRPAGARFDPVAAERCLNVTGLNCDASPLELNHNCALVFVPTVPTGGACKQSTDCAAPTLVCEGTDCNATCKPFGALGAPCLGDDVQRFCAPDLRCDETLHCAARGELGEFCRDREECAPGLQCEGGACVAGVAVGQPCPPLGACVSDGYCDMSESPNCQQVHALGTSCTNSTQCGEAAFCQSGACAPRLANAASCATDRQCSPALRCIVGVCAAPALEDGAACNDDGTGCAQPLVCDVVDHRCRIIRSVGDGAACTGHTLRCDSSGATRCIGGTCVTRGAGDPCDLVDNPNGGLTGSHTQCPPTTFCEVNGDAGVCTTSTAGSPCHFGRNCQADQFCDLVNGCTARKSAGATCDDPRDCAEGLTCDVVVGADPDEDPNGGGASTCKPLQTVGSACTRSCPLPLLCVSGACAKAGLNGEACVDGICLDGACANGLCSGKLAGGSACLLDAQCESAVCREGACLAVCQ